MVTKIKLKSSKMETRKDKIDGVGPMMKFLNSGYFSGKQELFLALVFGVCFLGGILEILFATSIF